MAKKKDSNPTAKALRDIEERGDRLTEWAAENAVLILGTIAGVLVIAAGAGLYIQHGTDARDAAANALALATSQYRLAMGADPTSGAIVEPANRELGERTRTEYAKRFSEVAEAHSGTTASALAWLEAGNLEAELGRLDDATASFSAARDAAANQAIGALASVRLAGMAEDRGDPAAAAEAFEAAAAVDAYPLRAEALTAAARCWVEAGQSDRALAVYQRYETEYPDEVVVPQIQSLIAELRLRRQP